jgi:hypothetical protein
MIRALGPLAACAMMATIVACAKRDPVADEANNTAGLPVLNAPQASADGSPPAGATAGGEAPAATAAIPAALHGRWGLTPRDCTSSLGDAKGLLIVNGNELRFYESRAVPAGDAQADSNSISGTFNFTGEGQSWTKFQSLQLQKDDLVRTETNPTASFTYAKCR